MLLIVLLNMKPKLMLFIWILIIVYQRDDSSDEHLALFKPLKLHYL